MMGNLEMIRKTLSSNLEGIGSPDENERKYIWTIVLIFVLIGIGFGVMSEIVKIVRQLSIIIIVVQGPIIAGITGLVAGYSINNIETSAIVGTFGVFIGYNSMIGATISLVVLLNGGGDYTNIPINSIIGAGIPIAFVGLVAAIFGSIFRTYSKDPE